MARAGLGGGWSCAFANDFDPMKGEAYTANWGSDHFHLADINSLAPGNLPGEADLAWASFPCQDLSLAGNYAGLGSASDNQQTRSGTFWGFWRLMLGLQREGRAPRTIVLENVYGVLTANEGGDFVAIASALAQAGYRFGALLVDAVHFLPQSRPRVFIVAVQSGHPIPSALLAAEPQLPWHPPALIKAAEALPAEVADAWLWWRLPLPNNARPSLVDIIEETPRDVTWHQRGETDRLVSLMNQRHADRLEQMKRSPDRTVGTVYRRTRQGQQRAELRSDGIAGCLRTPAGGSSKQFVLLVEKGRVRSRLLSAREAARLMGLPDSYVLPQSHNDAYHVAGDGVAVPVVRHLAAAILEPLLNPTAAALAHAAE